VLREVPDSAWWPRLMTVPHPRAVGSIGAEFVGWVRTELGISLRWWQVLFAVRLLEADAAGELVWTAALLTLARQCGKSLVVFCLCEWRSEQAARFGEPQLVLHTADSLEHAKAVWNRAHRRALAHGWGLRRAAGEYEIDKGDGTWLVRSQNAAVGYTASLAVADECHAIKPVTIDERLGPTTLEAAQSQILLVSTAARDCSETFPRCSTRRPAVRGRRTGTAAGPTRSAPPPSGRRPTSRTPIPTSWSSGCAPSTTTSGRSSGPPARASRSSTRRRGPRRSPPPTRMARCGWG
jgi:hypothetical protein